VTTLRRACAAIILTLAPSVSVLAGEIDCPGVVATPTPSPLQIQTETTATVTTSIASTIILVIIDLIP